MLKRAGYESWTKEALVSRILELEKSSSPKGLKRAQDQASESITDQSLETTVPPKKKQKQMDFLKYSTRKVAIRFAYLGWNYYGLAYQKDSGVPTVEGHILGAFHKTRCIPSIDPADCDFSRCGRTDRDVSAMQQVISLKLRSNLSPGEQQDPTMDHKELDYLKILNSHLPDDILAYEICLRPPSDFNARFSCTWRHYRYYFSGRDLDVAKMNEAAQLLLGEQDFRNFCKIDAAKQITNYKRTILESQIIEGEGDKCYLSLRGTAFLWNQVRSIMALLFLVGQGLEKPSIVAQLLDVESNPRRPAYEIAWGVPLVLYQCGYTPMEWKKSMYTSKDNIFNVWYEHWTKQTMAATMLDTINPFTGTDSRPLSANVGKGVGRRSKYVAVMDRPRNSTYEETNKKWRDKKKK